MRRRLGGGEVRPEAVEPVAGGEPSAPESGAAEDLLSTSRAGSLAIRGGALRLGAFLGGTVVSVVAAAVLFRYLGVVRTGRYTTALALGAVVTGFTDLGLTTVGIRELAVLEGSKRTEFARDLLGIRLVLTSIGVAAITLFAFFAYGSLLGFGVLIAGAGVLVQNTQVTLALPLLATLRLGLVALLELIRQVSNALFIVALVLAGAGLLPLLGTVAFASVLALIPTARIVRTSIPLIPAFGVSRWRALVGPVLTYSIAVAASTLYFRIALVLVSVMTSSHELGYFSASYRVVEGLIVIPGLLVGGAFPIFARAARDDMERLAYAIARVFEVACILGVWVSLAVAVGAPFAIRVIGGAHFAPAAKVLAVQGIAVGAMFVGVVWGYGLLSLHLHRVILLFNTSLLVLVTVLVVALIPLDGAQGAAIGVATAESIGAIAGLITLARHRAELRPRLRVLPRVVVAAALGATPALATGLPDIVRVVLATIIYGAVVIALKAPPAELYDAVTPKRLRRAG